VGAIESTTIGKKKGTDPDLKGAAFAVRGGREKKGVPRKGKDGIF